MAEVSWSDVEADAMEDIGRVRGTYGLSKENQDKLLKLIDAKGGAVTLSTDMVRNLFYSGSGNPGASSLVITLNKHFPDLKFGSRQKGERIVITMKK